MATLDWEIRLITAREAVDFVLPRHYAGRRPQVSVAFGLYCNGDLMAVCTFGKPASPSLCVGICGPAYAGQVYELNRLCRVPEWTHPLSSFLAGCLRRLRTHNWIVVSYADDSMGHHGYVYQACNFLYTGTTRPRTDMYTPGNRHSRHYTADHQVGLRKVRHAKHRYVYFCTSSRRLLREWRANLRYPVLPYPKGDNRYYTLGEYQVPEIVLQNRVEARRGG